ncbi:terminase large subunit [Secundilactobacillus pentosiphilus]|uniref:Terminase large subunit n=1 Tax=Secundilactobacillus pentosiphilus TaxID=1714682 RepID=A0A1Z5ISK4_9LACO|nr:terminase large subunit [Secundilactobacillus pentosiphilus]
MFDQVNPTFIRQKSDYVNYVPVYYSYNPPKNPYAWINEWVDEKRSDPDYLIDESTYLNDELGVTTKQQLDLINKYKENDYDYYRYLYLGQAVGLGTNVYNMALFHPLQQLLPDDSIQRIAFAVDAGHINSATTCLCVGITSKGKTILLNTYYYSPEHQTRKKAPSDLVPEIEAFEKRMHEQYPVKVLKRTIDSAEGALRNEFVKEYNEYWHGVAKSDEATMIDYVSSLLAQGRVYYLDIPANEIFVEQHQQYQWDEKTVHSDEPRVIKENDHTVDAFKYFAIDNARELGLRQGKAVPKAKPAFIH